MNNGIAGIIHINNQNLLITNLFTKNLILFNYLHTVLYNLVDNFNIICIKHNYLKHLYMLNILRHKLF